MKLHIFNPYLSRNGGGIFTVISELYTTHTFKFSKYSKMEFWGFQDRFSKDDNQLLLGKIHLYPIKYRVLNKLFYSKILKQDLTNCISSVDLIHLHSLWMYPSYIITKLQRKKNYKKLISTHGMLDKWALNNSRLKKIIAMALFEKTNLNSANCVHALCEQEYHDIRKIASKVPIAIIPNGINLPIEKFSKQQNHEEKTVLFLSRIHPKKGLVNLIYAWGKIKTSNWKLIIAGPDENDHTSKLIQLIKELNLEKSVKLIGPKFGEEKTILLSKSDAFILPSFSEGLPMSVLEAWSYKLPVIMTPQCNLPDGFQTNSAIRIEPEIESIVDGLNKLFTMNENDLIQMGLNGYKLVCKKYTWESVAKQMIELYDWVLGKIEKPSFVRLD